MLEFFMDPGGEGAVFMQELQARQSTSAINKAALELPV